VNLKFCHFTLGILANFGYPLLDHLRMMRILIGHLIKNGWTRLKNLACTCPYSIILFENIHHPSSPPI
jgi:hypothetical protein